ncbi:multiubiquitin domain-containing protein [Microbacterium maritypicum]|uniref:multiubiquitin domain-containing protein n=1 Tax=Microbacterium maritypicum TaxID=33918 RepID=UPI0037F8CC14
MASSDPIHIIIDGRPYNAPKRRLTGVQLRELLDPTPKNIWLDVADAQDHLVGDAETIALKDGMRFFTDRALTIYIDKVPYLVRSTSITEDQLRALPQRPIPESHGVWRDVQDDLDDPIRDGEVVTLADGDRFFSRAVTVRITVNRQQVSLNGRLHTGQQIKDAAIAQGVAISADFLLLRKTGKSFTAVGDDEQVRVRRDEKFRAVNGDDNS